MSDESKYMQKVEKQEVQSAEGAERLSTRRAFAPRCDIYEGEDALTIFMDMPGVDENSIDITLEKNVLRIFGKTEEKIYEGMSKVFSEYEEGDFERAFTLAAEIDRENIKASMKNGELRLDLPKAIEAKARKIAVQSA